MRPRARGLRCTLGWIAFPTSMKPKTVKDFLHSLPGKLDAEAAEDVDAVYQFDLSGAQGGQYVVTIREGHCQVKEGRHEDPHVILSMAGEDCVRVLNGEL